MEKRLGPFPSTPEGAPTPALGERSGAPSGLRPSSFVMCNTPVEVEFITSAGCLHYPCRTPRSGSKHIVGDRPGCAGRARWRVQGADCVIAGECIRAGTFL